MLLTKIRYKLDKNTIYNIVNNISFNLNKTF